MEKESNEPPGVDRSIYSILRTRFNRGLLDDALLSGHLLPLPLPGLLLSRSYHALSILRSGFFYKDE